MWQETRVPEINRDIKIPAISPKMSATPGKTVWAGGKLGSHSEEIFKGFLGLDDDKLAQLEADGAIVVPK